MQNAKTWTCRTILVCGGALTLTLIPARAWSQQDPGAQYQNQENQYQNSNNDNEVRQGIANLDQFLDNHPSIEKDLESNPALVNDTNYLTSHPELRDFCDHNPGVKAELQRNPNLVVQRENRFEGSRRDHDRAPGLNPNPDLTAREVGGMDQFLDDHPKVEKELEKNPSRINDRGFLHHNKDLETFLNGHPQIREEFAENPSYFMHRENEFEGTTADRDRAPGRNPNPDLTQREVGRMDQFLDDHPKIEKDLEKNPSLINDRRFLEHNRDVAQFLNEHPRIHDEFAENPSYFMQREDQFEGTAADRDHMMRVPSAATTSANPNPDLTRDQVARMDQFLDDHPDIEKQLERNPSLMSNNKYVRRHKDLDRLLSENRGLRTEFSENPSYFIHRDNQFEGTPTDRDAMRIDRDRDRDRDQDRNVADMHKFLEKHKTIAKDLDRNPERANDHRYLQHHKDLRGFFDEHRQCRTEFAENPRHFMEREHDFRLHNDHRLDNRRPDKDRNKNLEHRANTEHRNQL